MSRVYAARIERTRRKTGVILGMPAGATLEQAEAIRRQAEERFPGVVVAVVEGAQSVAFEFNHVDEVTS